MGIANFADKTVWTKDNLEILRGINSECVDLVYLDPPFNSNRTYAAPVGSAAAGAAFKDSWHLSELDEAWLGLIADEYPAVYQLLMAARLTHGKGMQAYLCMMAVRLLEMRRVLKPTGSLYLHCDPTASHYLKGLCDAVFGAANFRNEITWQRTNRGHKGSQFAPRAYQTNTDTLLFYAKSKQTTFNIDAALLPYEEGYERKTYNRTDEKGRYKRESPFRRRGAGARPNLCYTYKGITAPIPTGWSVSLERLKELDATGDLEFVGERVYRKIRSKGGRRINNLWLFDDIGGTLGKERTEYPTQKPLALLERIIAISSNPGELVLDPFAGCATACVAAEKLARQWAGIDLSPKAVDLVKMRLSQLPASLRAQRQDVAGLVTARTDIPRRTDIGEVPHYRKQKHKLFGRQEGRCNGCGVNFEFRHLAVDHVVPQSKGGTDHLDNLQLLCSHCNSVKGTRSQAQLLVRLRQLGIR